MHIRPARVETDLPAIVRITNPYEAKPLTVDLVRSFFQFSPPGRIQRRLVAVDEQDAVIAYGGFVHEASFPAGRFTVWVIVDPPYRRQGTGSAVWETLLADLHAQGATRLTSDVFDHDSPALAFAERRGFTIERHTFYSVLDLAAFDETPYLPLIAGLESQGLRFCSLADFPDLPETRRKLYDLNIITELDVPGSDDILWTYTEFDKFVFQAPWFCPAGQLLAVDGEIWAGMAAVSLSSDGQSAYNEHTGVLRTHRGRKIAQALKVIALRYARQNGAQVIRTDNDSLNTPILAINRKLGYQPQPGKYWLVRDGL